MILINYSLASVKLSLELSGKTLLFSAIVTFGKRQAEKMPSDVSLSKMF
jgi:hypothetical protein